MCHCSNFFSTFSVGICDGVSTEGIHALKFERCKRVIKRESTVYEYHINFAHSPCSSSG